MLEYCLLLKLSLLQNTMINTKLCSSTQTILQNTPLEVCGDELQFPDKFTGTCIITETRKFIGTENKNKNVGVPAPLSCWNNIGDTSCIACLKKSTVQKRTMTEPLFKEILFTTIQDVQCPSFNILGTFTSAGHLKGYELRIQSIHDVCLWCLLNTAA